MINLHHFRFKSREISRNLAQYLVENYKIAEEEVENLISGIEMVYVQYWVGVLYYQNRS